MISPPASMTERFILSSASEKIRIFAILPLSHFASSNSSFSSTPSRTSRPGPILATICPSISTEDSRTRWMTARMLFLVVKPALQDDQSAARGLVNETVFVIDALRPPTREIVFQRLGFPDSSKRIFPCLLDHSENPLGQFRL